MVFSSRFLLSKDVADVHRLGVAIGFTSIIWPYNWENYQLAIRSHLIYEMNKQLRLRFVEHFATRFRLIYSLGI